MQYLSYVILVEAIITVIISWAIYRKTMVKSMLCIFVAMCLGVVSILTTIVGEPFITYKDIIRVAFWTLWVVGLYLLLNLLKKYYGKRR